MRPNYQGKSFLPLQCPCSTCMPCFLTGPIIHVQYVCSPLSPPPQSSCSSVLFILVVLYVKLQLLSLPSPFPILAAAGLFCTTPQVQVARATPPHPPKLLLLVIKVGAWWGWTPPRLSKECRLNVLLLYLQQPPPAAHHAPTHWSGCWCNFPLCVSS